MSNSKLIELSYYDPSAQVRLSAYADTLVLDHDQNGSIIRAIRFGGYPEMVRAMADAIYGGATIEAAQNDTTRMLQSSLKSYQRQITHDGIYAVATLIAADTVREDDRSGKHEKDEDTNLVDTEQMELQPRRCYIFCPARDQKRLFEELDHKTAAPLIPEFQDYVLSSLRQRGDLRQLEVISLKERIDAWVLDLKPQDHNVVEVLERGLQSGDIQIPGAVPNMPDGFENVENVTGYLNTFGVTVADRIRSQFMPLFDPAKEPLSDEVLAINDCIMSRVGYSLYDAQLAVAEAVKRQLARKRVALIIAECGSGKTKIGSTALGALHGLWADQKRKDGRKSFGIVMCPSHVTQKWVREIGETLPDTYGMVVRTIQDLNRLYAMYEKGDKSVFAVFSKEQARDGYEEIPVPLEMPEDVRTAYKEAEHELQKVLRTDRKAAQKILSTYLNLLTVYPDQPYDQPEVVHPINGMPIVTPKNCGDFSRLFPKEERVLELVRQKAANGERVLIYTSWTRTDSQKKLQKLLCSEGYRTEILTPQIATDKREDWVNKRVKGGLQVLITNPRCVETGLDLNAFTTIIFYSMGYNLFTLRQASRRSWRINQTALRVEVYMLYYTDTMQAKAMKLMASKLAVAGIIEGTFSEEGLAAMSDVKDLTSQMAKELALGIRDNVEDIAAAFRKMAVMNPERKKNIAAAQLKETAAEEQKAPAAKDSFGVRTAQAQVRQALYEGLLARTAEEQKKRKSKKAEVDENQLSIFGFAA